MAEVGSAYVSVLPSLKGFGTKLNSELAGPLDKAGKKGGQTVTAAFGKVAKTGLKTAAAGIGAVAGTALFKGFDRLKGIENAQAKLRGLGHSAAAVDKIMDNALQSVKGTAFGLDEAATVAAGAVASGVKPGRELERTLSLVGDAATIGGTSLSEMGAIFNKVAASGKIQGDVIAQLGDKGIPILQLLAKQLRTTPADVAALASKGKVDFATFQKAMEDGLGGAALESGNTFTGAFKNMNAALGRLGASVLKGVFPQVTKGFGSVTAELDKLGPAAEKFGKKFGDFVRDAGPPTIETLKGIADAGKTVLPVVEGIAKGFGALPGGSQKILALAAAALILKNRFDIVNPSLSNFNRQAALARVKSTAVTGGALAAAGGLAALSAKAGGASTGLGQLSTIAAGTATGFAVGGPWGAALGAAGGVLAVFTTRSDAAADSQRQFQAAGASVVATLNEQTGALTAASRAAVAKDLQDSGALSIAKSMGIALSDVTNATLGNKAALDRVNQATARYQAANQGSAGASLAAKAATDFLSQSISGVRSNVNAYRRGLNETNEALGKIGGRKVVAEIRVDGLGGALAGLGALGSRLDAIARKSGKVKAGNNARGTDYWRGGLTWVGEQGPELINLQRGAQVHTASQSRRIANMKPRSRGRGGVNVSVADFAITDWESGMARMELMVEESLDGYEDHNRQMDDMEVY